MVNFFVFLKKKLEFFIIRLYNFWISCLSPANFSYWWNFGSMALVCLILQAVINIFFAMDYKSNIILIIVGLIIHKLIVVFDLKFSYVQLDFIYIFKKFYTTSAFRQLPTGSKKFSHYGHPIILKYYKIFNSIYSVDMNLTHNDETNGIRNVFVGKDKKGNDVYAVVSDIKIKEIRNKEHAWEVAEQLAKKYKDFEVTQKEEVEHLFNHVEGLINIELEKRFGKDAIICDLTENISTLEKKINMLRNDELFNVFIWKPISNKPLEIKTNLMDLIKD